MYCPKYKQEYQGNDKNCPDCKVELVELLPLEKNGRDPLKAVKVATASNEIEAGLIMDLLLNNQIPCYKKSKGAGGYLNIYMGYSVYGEEIYVAEKDYQRAKALLDELTTAPEEEEEDNTAEDSIPFYRNPRITARIILILFLATTIMTCLFHKFF
jgi:hypothetical protein